MVALRRKNTLEQTGFALTEGGFSYRGQAHRLEDVVETARLRQRLETRHLLVGSEFTHSISVVFSMKTGEKVQLTEHPTLFFNSRAAHVERIDEIFNAVSERTFQGRLQKYLTQLQTQQFFEYSGWQFHPGTQTVVDSETKQMYSTRSAKFLRSFGFIEVREGPDGFGAAIDRTFGGRVGINTLRDTDVLFALLSKFFGLAWP